MNTIIESGEQQSKKIQQLIAEYLFVFFFLSGVWFQCM